MSLTKSERTILEGLRAHLESGPAFVGTGPANFVAKVQHSYELWARTWITPVIDFLLQGHHSKFETDGVIRSMSRYIKPAQNPHRQSRRRASSYLRNATSKRGVRGAKGEHYGYDPKVTIREFGGHPQQVKYEDATDGKYYYHDFESDAEMYLCDSAIFGRCILIASPSHTPLWTEA